MRLIWQRNAKLSTNAKLVHCDPSFCFRVCSCSSTHQKLLSSDHVVHVLLGTQGWLVGLGWAMKSQFHPPTGPNVEVQTSVLRPPKNLLGIPSHRPSVPRGQIAYLGRVYHRSIFQHPTAFTVPTSELCLTRLSRINSSFNLRVSMTSSSPRNLLRRRSRSSTKCCRSACNASCIQSSSSSTSRFRQIQAPAITATAS